MALESITLPSRLRPSESKRGLLDDMEAALNVNGNQRIASVRCSIPDATTSDSQNANLSQADRDRRVPGSNTSDELHGGDSVRQTNARFDMELSCGEAKPSGSGRVHDRATEHIFGSVECFRDQKESLRETNGVEDEGISRKRRRLAGVPIIERSVFLEVAVQHHGKICDCAGSFMQSRAK